MTFVIPCDLLAWLDHLETADIMGSVGERLGMHVAFD